MEHRTDITVRGYHLDLYGHVNNARYLEFLEEARWRMVETGSSLESWRRRGLAFVIVKISINYRRGAVLDDVLTIESRLARMGGRSGVIVQDVKRGDELVADAEVTFVIMDIKTGKATAISGDVRQELESLS